MAIQRDGLMEDSDNEQENGLSEEAGIPDLDSDTPPHLRELALAVQVGDVHTLRQALDNLSGSVDESLEDGDTALHLLLIERGADLEAKDKDGAIPLHDACASGFTEIAQLLLNSANSAERVKRMLETVDAEGDSPLHHAARGEHAEVIHLLLASGASAPATNLYGKTPADLPKQGTEARRIFESADNEVTVSRSILKPEGIMLQPLNRHTDGQETISGAKRILSPLPLPQQQMREKVQKYSNEEAEVTPKESIMSDLHQQIWKEETASCPVSVQFLRKSEKTGNEIVTDMLSCVKTMEENEGGIENMNHEKEMAKSNLRDIVLSLLPAFQDKEQGFLDDFEEITKAEMSKLLSKLTLVQGLNVFAGSALYSRWCRVRDKRMYENYARSALEDYNGKHETDYALDRMSHKGCRFCGGYVCHLNFVARSTNNEKKMFFAEVEGCPGTVVTVCRMLEESVGIYRGCLFCTINVFHPYGVRLLPEPNHGPDQPWEIVSKNPCCFGI